MSFSGVPRGFRSVRQPPRLVTGSDPAVRRTSGYISRFTSEDHESERPESSVLREWRITALGPVGSLSLGSDKFSVGVAVQLEPIERQLSVGELPPGAQRHRTAGLQRTERVASTRRRFRSRASDNGCHRNCDTPRHSRRFRHTRLLGRPCCILTATCMK